MEKKKFFSARTIAYLAVLLALVVVLQAVGGVIVIGPVQLNFTLIPIALGAMLFGVYGGAFLGFACGIVVLIQVILGGGFYTVIWTGSPFITTLTCVVKTTAAGAVAGLIYRLLAKKNRYVATFVAAGLVPVINTLLFILGCLCMSDTLTAAYGVSGGDLLVFIMVGLITYNFFIEFALNMLLAPALNRVISAVEGTVKKGKKKKEAEPEVLEEESQAEESAEHSETGAEHEV